MMSLLEDVNTAIIFWNVEVIDGALARLPKLLAMHNSYNRKVETINIEVVFTKSL